MKETLKKFNSLLKRVVCTGACAAVMFNNIIANAPQLLKDKVVHKERSITTFYLEPKDSADVVFLGSSSVYRFVAPTQFYYKQGITSLNYVAPALDIHTTCGLIDEIIDHQHPKLIVVEMRNYVNNCDNYVEGVKFTQKQMNNKLVNFKNFVFNMPNSSNRTKVIKDTVGPVFGYNYINWQKKNIYIKYDESQFETKKWKKKYKNYKEVLPVEYKYEKRNDYKGAPYKGTTASTAIKTIKGNNLYDYNVEREITGKHLDLLNGILDHAENSGTQVLFISTPYVVNKKTVAYENAMGRIIQERGFNYINYNKLYKELKLDFNRDFYDTKHVNISGMVKVTNHLGKYIVDNYGLEKTKLSKSLKKSWDTATSKWIKEVRTPGLRKVKNYKVKK